MERLVPMVSVVIPTFRRPQFLNQALDSVYAQTFKDFEVIVADDGSGAEFTSQYNLRPDTKLVCNSESGTSSAISRNLGTRIARGRYVAYLDDDDVWMPDKLQKQVCVLEEDPNIGLTYCHHTLVDEDLRPLEPQPTPKILPPDCMWVLVCKNMIKSPSCVLMRRAVLDKCGLFDEHLDISEDWEMWARASCLYSFHADPAPLVLYRTHSAQKTASGITARRLGHVQVAECIYEWVEKDAPEVLPVVRRSLAFRLQKLSRWQACDGNYRSALKTIRRSIALCPGDIRSYTRLVQIAWYALRYHGRH